MGCCPSQPDPDGSMLSSILGAPSPWGEDRSREMTHGVSFSQPQPLTHTSPPFHPKKAHQGPWISLLGPSCQLVCDLRQEWLAHPTGLAWALAGLAHPSVM